MADREPQQPEKRQVDRWPRWPWQVFRIVAGLELLALLTQAVTAGQLLGNGGLGSLHGVGATAVHVFGLLLVPAAILLFRPGRGPGWPIVVAVVILVGGMVQSALGNVSTIGAHVPVGVLIMVLTTWLVLRPVPAIGVLDAPSEAGR